MKFSNSNNEKVLVNECLKNNRRAQRQLYDKYKNAMYTVVFRIVRNEVMACDALQEGFLKVFTNLQNYRFESTLGAWIKTIIVRTALRVLEFERKLPEYDEELTNTIITWDDNLTGEVLDRAIAGLSPGYRAVFVLIEVEGYSHKEVAEMLNISIGTSKSQLSRAKTNLQQELKQLIN